MFCQNSTRLSRWRAALSLLPALVLEMALVLPLGAPTANALPTGLPTHFAFGIGAGAGDAWMPQSGVPWDFRFQYLVGGVNTGSGWETWNANGTFALNYANESAQHGSRSTVARGSSVGITASVSSATASNVLVDVEVYNAAGARVFQTYW